MALIIPGKFIVVEGLDRAGKTTTVANLCNQLHAVAFKFPSRETPIGQLIDRFLKKELTFATDHDENMRIFQALNNANRWEKASAIRDALNSGKDVVCDRYLHSALAYSTIGVTYAYSIQNFVRDGFRGLPEPDVVLFLDISPEHAAKRGNYGEEVYEKIEMQKHVRQAFYTLMTNDIDQAMDVVHVDGLNEAEVVAKCLDIISRTERREEID